MSLTLRGPWGPGCLQERLAHPGRLGQELPGVEGSPVGRRSRESGVAGRGRGGVASGRLARCALGLGRRPSSVTAGPALAEGAPPAPPGATVPARGS